jgi:hypothetical protein
VSASFVSVAAKSADDVLIGRVGLSRSRDGGDHWDTDVGGFEGFSGSIFDILFVSGEHGFFTKDGGTGNNRGLPGEDQSAELVAIEGRAQLPPLRAESVELCLEARWIIVGHANNLVMFPISRKERFFRLRLRPRRQKIQSDHGNPEGARQQEEE